MMILTWVNAFNAFNSRLLFHIEKNKIESFPRCRESASLPSLPRTFISFSPNIYLQTYSIESHAFNSSCCLLFCSSSLCPLSHFYHLNIYRMNVNYVCFRLAQCVPSVDFIVNRVVLQLVHCTIQKKGKNKNNK